MNRSWTEILNAIGPNSDGPGMDAISGVVSGGSSGSGAAGAASPDAGSVAGMANTESIALPIPVSNSLDAMVTSALQATAPGMPAGDGSDSPLIEGLSRLTTGVEQLRLTATAQVDSLLANTEAVSQNTVAQANRGSSSTASTLSKIFSPILQMSGVGSLVSGIVHLFGGGGESAAPAPLATYAAPPKIYYQETISQAARPATDSPTAGSAQSASAASGIQINVSAMDSRSFMDHSDEIASAVREALLRAHPLNDLISEGE